MITKQLAVLIILSICQSAVCSNISKSYCSLLPDLQGSPSDTIIPSQVIKIDPFYIDLVPPSTGISFYKDGVLVLAPQENSRKKVNRHISFGSYDTFYGHLSDSGIYDRVPFLHDILFNYPSDGLTFTGDYSTMYYTGINPNNGISNIYGATLQYEGNRMTKPLVDLHPMNLYNDYNNSHPALSADGKIMIFSSDREGTNGETDLYITRLVDGEWSVPERLDNGINTPGNELFAFLDNNNNLFFSSDGHPGSGGYDVFVSIFNENEWENPVNLTPLVNSEMDDIAFIVDPVEQNSGFVTRRDRNGGGRLKLFRLTTDDTLLDETAMNLPEMICSLALRGYILNLDLIPEKSIINTENPDLNIKDNVSTTDSIADLRIVYMNEPVQDSVIFKVQIKSVNPPDLEPEVVIDDKLYNTNFYFYDGGWRMTIGEFTHLEDADDIREKCRKEGYDQAFVVAFVNGTRSLDMSLFKR